MIIDPYRHARPRLTRELALSRVRHGLPLRLRAAPERRVTRAPGYSLGRRDHQPISSPASVTDAIMALRWSIQASTSLHMMLSVVRVRGRRRFPLPVPGPSAGQTS